LVLLCVPIVTSVSKTATTRGAIVGRATCNGSGFLRTTLECGTSMGASSRQVD